MARLTKRVKHGLNVMRGYVDAGGPTDMMGYDEEDLDAEQKHERRQPPNRAEGAEWHGRAKGSGVGEDCGGVGQSMKTKLPMTELSDMEKSIYRKVQTANFPPATASKSFMQGDADVIRWSDRGRAFMAFIAHRFRRQYALTAEEWAWVDQWKRDE